MDSATPTTQAWARQPPPSPFSIEMFIFLTNFIRVGLWSIIALAGIVSNIINIVVFYRQGPMSNSSTVVFFGLAISDLLTCVFALIISAFTLYHINFMDYTKFYGNLMDFATIYFGRPMNLMNQITCGLTTFLTFERAFSVMFPFKVKSIFTTKRCLAAVVTIFIVTFIIHIPNLFQFTARLTTGGMLYIPLILDATVAQIWAYVSPIGLRTASVVLVITFNLIIFWKVKISQKFRSSNKQTDSSSEMEKHKQSNDSKERKTPQTSSKDMKLLRMIVVVSVVFTACYSLSVPHAIVLGLVFKGNVDYHWAVEFLVFNINVVFQLLSASTNAVIYYNMSSRFKEDVQLLCWKKRCCKK